jgi:hypothetical protein
MNNIKFFKYGTKVILSIKHCNSDICRNDVIFAKKLLSLQNYYFPLIFNIKNLKK